MRKDDQISLCTLEDGCQIAFTTSNSYGTCSIVSVSVKNSQLHYYFKGILCIKGIL